MISRLNGIVVDIDSNHLVIDVNGVGYQVAVTAHAIKNAIIDSPIILHIETIVREDAFLLFGFDSKIERDWFVLLINKVQGIGSKSALAVLSTLSLNELSAAIKNDDIKSITRAPGVGPKVAQRIIAELRDKLPKGDIFNGSLPTIPLNPIASQAVNGLVSLGYDKSKAENAIKKGVEELGDYADISALIKFGIKNAF